MLKHNKHIERFRFFTSLGFAFLLTAIMWIVKFFELTLNLDFSNFGVLPHSLSGFKGILFSPFIHGSIKHLFSNTFPFLVLTTLLFNVYYEKRFLIFLLIYFTSGVLLWLIGRENYHIGASGIIYGLASFNFFAGVLSKKREYIAISLIVIFLYGSFIWGIFPVKDVTISWEGHLSGFISGAFYSLFFYKKPDVFISDFTKSNVNLKYNYDFNVQSSTIINNISYIYINQKYSTLNYFIYYEADFNTNSSNFYQFTNFSSTTVF